MSDVPCFVGIDVAKTQLDVALRPSGERRAVANDASGVATLVDWVQTLHPTLIVLEATGGLERAVTSALAAAGLPVVVVNPRQARDFARATGQLAKTLFLYILPYGIAVDGSVLAHACGDACSRMRRSWQPPHRCGLLSIPLDNFDRAGILLYTRTL
jgi:hypothetical protein